MSTVRRVVTSRRGGVSEPPYDSFNLAVSTGDDPVAVDRNHARLAREIGVPRDRIVWMSQVHGTRVAVVDKPQRRSVADTDALVTTTPGLVLAVRVADCVPILLADQRAAVAAVAHAGREGARAGVARSVVEAMVELGATPADIDVLLGPAICGLCYEVPVDMQAEVEEQLPGSACTTRAGTTGLDLRAGIAGQLLASGVGKVVGDPRCTAEDADFFSYRRDGVTGRQAGLAWIG